VKQEYKNIAKTSLIISLVFSVLTSPIFVYRLIDIDKGLSDVNFTSRYIVYIIFFMVIFLIWSFYTFFMLVALFSKWGYRVKHFRKIGFIAGTPWERMRSIFFLLLPFLSLFFMIKFCIYLISYY
tara:strand:- start:351 stop:725 length:375 start_codon:yes stop_codon:yes gene_type:complete